MKLALAIVCSFLLAGAPLIAAQASATSACAKQVRACCLHGHTMPCCAAKSSPGSQPAAPAPAAGATQLSLLAPGVLAWTLPVDPADAISSISAPSLLTASVPLFARHCARLI